ncbi:unnamed protein product, partial [Protopolystoma xenopodis]
MIGYSRLFCSLGAAVPVTFVHFNLICQGLCLLKLLWCLLTWDQANLWGFCDNFECSSLLRLGWVVEFRLEANNSGPLCVASVVCSWILTQSQFELLPLVPSPRKHSHLVALPTASSTFLPTTSTSLAILHARIRRPSEMDLHSRRSVGSSKLWGAGLISFCIRAHVAGFLILVLLHQRLPGAQAVSASHPDQRGEHSASRTRHGDYHSLQANDLFSGPGQQMAPWRSGTNGSRGAGSGPRDKYLRLKGRQKYTSSLKDSAGAGARSR